MCGCLQECAPAGPASLLTTLTVCLATATAREDPMLSPAPGAFPPTLPGQFHWPAAWTTLLWAQCLRESPTPGDTGEGGLTQTWGHHHSQGGRVSSQGQEAGGGPGAFSEAGRHSPGCADAELEKWKSPAVSFLEEGASWRRGPRAGTELD